MAAVLRIAGDRFALETFAARSGLTRAESIQSRRKQHLELNAPTSNKIFNLTVSNADGACIPRQIEQAVCFSWQMSRCCVQRPKQCLDDPRSCLGLREA